MPYNPDGSFSLNQTFGTGTAPDNLFPPAVGDTLDGIANGIDINNIAANPIFIAAVNALIAATPGAFPSGTLMLFQQTSAPTGWTKQSTQNDKALRVVSGTASTGGTSPFSTVFAQTATGGTVLSVANIPANTFLDLNTSLTVSTGLFNVYNSGAVTSVVLNQSFSGSSTAHTHPMDIRVQYVDIIIASKN